MMAISNFSASRTRSRIGMKLDIEEGAVAAFGAVGFDRVTCEPRLMQSRVLVAADVIAHVERGEPECFPRVGLDEVPPIIPGNIPVGARISVLTDIVGQQGLAEILRIESRFSVDPQAVR